MKRKLLKSVTGSGRPKFPSLRTMKCTRIGDGTQGRIYFTKYGVGGVGEKGESGLVGGRLPVQFLDRICEVRVPVRFLRVRCLSQPFAPRRCSMHSCLCVTISGHAHDQTELIVCHHILRHMLNLVSPKVVLEFLAHESRILGVVAHARVECE